MDKYYKAQVGAELRRYDMSLRAMLLGYDSWFIGHYLRSMRMVRYYSSRNGLIFNLLRGGAQVCLQADRP